MMFRKRILALGVAFSLLFGCATTYQGDGTIVEKHQVSVAEKKDLEPIKRRTLQGGLAGAASGVGVLVATMGIGAEISLALGAAGLILGAGAGVVEYSLMPSEKEWWRYEVKAINDTKTYSVTQKAPAMPLHAKVKIMERNGKVWLSPKGS